MPPQPQQAVVKKPEPIALAKAALRILVVDPEKDDRDYYRRLLQRSHEAQFEIVEADDARTALEICRDHMPDCIILDYALPDADGFTFIRACQKAFTNVPAAAFVMVTDRGSETTGAEAMQIGAHDYLPKATLLENFFPRRLINAVERARLKDQVKAYQEQLEQVNMAMSEFTHTVSHDLKAPLTRFSYYCNLVREEGGASLSTECLEYVDRMQVNVRRLQTLIDDLLAYSRTLHNQEELAEVDTHHLAVSIVDDLAEITKEAGAHVELGALPVVIAYPTRLRQLLQNLINNALKYKSPERAPHIKVSCVDAGDSYRFSIEDNGLGIDRKAQKRIFKPFERLHTQDKIEGSGIGLATCQKVVEMHRGRIWVESAPDVGSTFFFTIAKDIS